jgi:hypothetical protein
MTDPTGFFKLHNSLDISESNIKIDFAENVVLATKFTCGKTDPAAIDKELHRQYDAGVTYIEAMVRGKDRPEMYHGIIVRGGTGNIVWDDEPSLVSEKS